MKEDTKMLIILTIIIDLALIYILLYKVRDEYSKKYIILVLMVHVVFYGGLIYNNARMLDFSHILLPCAISFSLFIKNRYIKLLNLFLLIIIRLLWVIKKKCIINSLKTNIKRDYSVTAELYTLVHIILLTYHLAT